MIIFLLFLTLVLTQSCYSQEPELVVQMGHTAGVSSVCFSPDGKYALSGSWDNTLKLWDISTGKEIRTFTGHNSEVTSLSFSPDGKYALSGSGDSTLKLWDVRTGTEIKTFTGHSDEVSSVSFSPDGKFALSGSYDKTLKLWDISTGKEIRTFTGHKYMVNSVSYSPDGKYALSGSNDYTFKLWDINSGKEIRTFETHRSYVYSVAFSPDGKYALAGSTDTLKLWDISTGKEIRTFTEDSTEDSQWAKFVCFSPDGNYAISGSQLNTFKLWDINTGKEIRTFTENGELINSVSFSPDGKYALSGSTKTLKLWDISTGKEIRTFTGNSWTITSVSFSPDGMFALSGSFDETIKLWDISIGNEIKTFSGHRSWVWSNSFSPDGKYALSGSSDKTLKLWDISSGKEIRTFTGHNNGTTSVSFSPDGKYALSGSFDGTLKLWDISTGKEIRTFTGHSSMIESVSFSPDGQYALSGSWDKTLKLWDINTGKEIRTFTGHSNWVTSVSFSPDGKYALSGSRDNKLKLWDLATGEEIRTFSGHSSGVNSVSFSPDGKNALSGSVDKTLKLWDLSTGKETRTFKGHTSSVSSVSFSPDGKYALSGSFDCTMKLWNIEKGEEVLTLIPYGEKDYISITPDNYYKCSKGGLDGIAFVIDNRAFPPEQFDLQYNRPDIVLERIGYADSSLINAYREAYYKRLRKMKFKEEWFKPDFYMPEIKIENKDEFFNNVINERDIKLKISAKDEKGNPLDRINVFVNGVPIFGTNGIDLTSENVFNIEKEIDVQLNDSVNKIEVSVLNHAGVESLKDNIEVRYIGNKEEPKTYFIGIGVSDYKDKNKKLNFAAKDIRDLAGLYRDKAIIDTLIDEQATRENILKLKEKLLNTKVDDEIIIALSGHGILSDSNDFYYATWDMDFKKPELNGLLFDDLDKLLDSIPARKKVLLIDACNSGEVDREQPENNNITSNAELNKEEGNESNKGNIEELKKSPDKTKVGLKNSFELMQEIFVNLTRGNGAIVISAARGSQSALENKGYGETGGNGAFTACIIELIKSKKPGEYIKVGELKDYVIKRVEELTNGSQKPTSRRENLVYDFVVW